MYLNELKYKYQSTSPQPCLQELKSTARRELVVAAKEWNEAKQVTTLWSGNLVGAYVELEAELRGDLGQLKVALIKKAGFKGDPLIAGKKVYGKDTERMLATMQLL